MLKKGLKWAFWIVVVFVALSFLSNRFFPTSAIGVLEVTGGIYSSDDILDQIEDLKKDSRIKGVLLRIDSPGGTVAASQEIFESLQKLGAVKPIIASCGTLAASGGYYVALAAKEIFANPGTLTGSIGVRMEHMEIGDLLQWAKVHYETLKSGELKDMGSLQRPMTPEEKQLIESMLHEIHQQFKKAVAEARHLPMEAVEKVADGRVLTGEEAFQAKLVDHLGGRTEAIARLMQVAGLKGEPHLIYNKEGKDWWVRFLTKTQILSPLPVPLFYR